MATVQQLLDTTLMLPLLLPAQMIEELFLALVMSLVFALPAWYLCIFQGNFAVFWLAWLLSLADGIGAQPARASHRMRICIHCGGYASAEPSVAQCRSTYAA